MEDSLTSGRISIVCAPEVGPIITRTAAAFDSLYPGSSIAVTNRASRDAIRALFAGRCDLAVITRELEPEERAAAKRGGLEIEGYRFARDAVAIVVHPSNRLENISLEEVRRIYRGVIRRWDAVGGSALPIEPVIPPPGGDLAEYFGQKVMNGEPMLAPAAYAVSDSEVLSFVAGHAGAMGFVSRGWEEAKVKALRVASLRGLRYVRPDPEAVYRGDYPLARPMNLYVRGRGPALANGLITFITSMDGQKLVHEGGLVPTAVPVRFVRRSPMLGAHDSLGRRGQGT